jgi:uncharacterized protein (UPF0332 family)
MSEAESNEVVGLRLASAKEALADAETLLKWGSLRGAINRCYYAVFYAAAALALQDGNQFRKHSALIAWFQKAYIRDERLPRELGRTLQKAFDKRSEADYQDIVRISEDEVTHALEECGRFVARVREHIQQR